MLSAASRADPIAPNRDREEKPAAIRKKDGNSRSASSSTRSPVKPPDRGKPGSRLKAPAEAATERSGQSLRMAPVAPARAPVETQTTAPPEIPTYLIAFKDHTIYAAVAYWVEGQTL